MPRAVRSQSNRPAPLLAANVPGSSALMLTLIPIWSSCDLITAATWPKSSGVEKVDIVTSKPFPKPACRISVRAFARLNFR